jgi:hypothetical protein
MRGPLLAVCILGLVSAGLPALGHDPDFAAANLAYLRSAAQRAGAPLDPSLDSKLQHVAQVARGVDLADPASRLTPLPGHYAGWVEYVCLSFFIDCDPPEAPATLPLQCASIDVPYLAVWDPQMPVAHFPAQNSAYLFLWTTGQLGLTPLVVGVPGEMTFVGSGCVRLSQGWILDYAGDGVVDMG